MYSVRGYGYHRYGYIHTVPSPRARGNTCLRNPNFFLHMICMYDHARPGAKDQRHQLLDQLVTSDAIWPVARNAIIRISIS